MATVRWISNSSGDFNTTANWSTGSKPTTGDTIIFDGTGTASLTTNLNQSTATGVTLHITQANTAAIGTDTGGTATYLQIGASNAYIGEQQGGQDGTGSPLILLDYGSTSNTTTVVRTTSAAPTNVKYPALSIKGTAITLNALGGSTGVAVRPGESATLATIRTTDGAGGGSPSVVCGGGVTITAGFIASGNLTSFSDNTCAAMTVAGGIFEYFGTGAHTVLNVDAGTAYYDGTGTIASGRVQGTLSFARDTRSKTITNMNCYKGGTLNMDNGTPGSITLTNPIVLVGCKLGSDGFTIQTPSNMTVQLAAE